jgi:uncharacterized membrane protein YccC
MTDVRTPRWLRPESGELIHALRTTAAATASLLIARMFHSPEAYWAAVTTIIVMQSSLGAAWDTSKQRLAGTAIGAGLGALLAAYAGPNWAVFAGGVLAAGVICAVFRVGRSAFRYSGITLAIVMLVPRTLPYWLIAIHRFVEISLGIAVGLALTAAWPQPQPTNS